MSTVARLTVFDLLVVLLVALSAYRGFRRGLVGELLSLAAFLGALLLAFRFDASLGRVLKHIFGGLSVTEARIIAFLVILIAVEVAAGVLISIVSRGVGRVPILGGLDRVGGIVVGAVLALFAVWLVTAALLLMPLSLLPWASAVRRSETAHLLRTVTPRYGADLRAYAAHFTSGHPSATLERELRLLTGTGQ